MRPLPLVAALLLLALSSPLAHAHSGKAIEVQALSGDNCPSGDLCFKFFTPPPEVAPGEIVDLILYNDAEQSHMALLTTKAQADPQRQDTSDSAAIAFTNQVPPGQVSEEQIFDVPDADTLYIWCGIGDHEAQGMWLEVPVAQADGGADGNNAPLGPWAALAALMLAGAVLRRR